MANELCIPYHKLMAHNWQKYKKINKYSPYVPAIKLIQGRSSWSKNLQSYFKNLLRFQCLNSNLQYTVAYGQNALSCDPLIKCTKKEFIHDSKITP